MIWKNLGGKGGPRPGSASALGCPPFVFTGCMTCPASSNESIKERMVLTQRDMCHTPDGRRGCHAQNTPSCVLSEFPVKGYKEGGPWFGIVDLPWECLRNKNLHGVLQIFPKHLRLS